MSHQLDRADVLEAMGKYHLALARKAKNDGARNAERREARSCFEGSIAIWRNWIKRNLASPYAARRESSAALAIASIDAGREIPNVR